MFFIVARNNRIMSHYTLQSQAKKLWVVWYKGIALKLIFVLINETMKWYSNITNCVVMKLNCNLRFIWESVCPTKLHLGDYNVISVPYRDDTIRRDG